jgi:hypothetical protein
MGECTFLDQLSHDQVGYAADLHPRSRQRPLVLKRQFALFFRDT